MKKILMIGLTLLIAFVFAVPAMAHPAVSLKKAGMCKGTHDVKMKFNLNFPGGFPTWANAKTGEVYPNVNIIQINQIQEIYIEVIYEGGFLDFYPLERGKDWFSKNGHLVINATVCMPPGTVMQIFLVGSYGEFQLAVDDPNIFMGGIHEVFNFGPGCGFHQLRDGTWGITCY